MSEPLVLRQDKDGLATLTLNRPDKLNSLTVGMFRELRHHVLDLEADDSVNCVILRGAGKCFSAGHDLGDIAEGEKVPSPGWHSETLRLMERLPKPVIAAVHGHCYTGALEVALAADFIIAAESARQMGAYPDLGHEPAPATPCRDCHGKTPDVHRRHDQC